MRHDCKKLKYMRQFYLIFPIRDALRRELTWSHYRLIMQVKSEQKLKDEIRTIVKEREEQV